MKHEAHRGAALALAALIAIGGCSKGGPSSPQAPVVPVATDPIVLSTTALVFGPSDVERSITLTNQGSAAVAWRSEVSEPWLLVTPAAGTLTAGSTAITVHVERGALAPGGYTGQVRVVGSERSHAVAVTAEVASLAIVELDRTTIDLGPDDADTTVQLTNVGNVPLTWSLAGPSWIVTLPASGALGVGGSQAITLTPDRSTLMPGAHQAELTLTSDAGSTSILVRVQVDSPPSPPPPPARLRVEPQRLDFGSGTTGPLQALVINDGGELLTWSASTTAAWVHLTRSEGTVAPGAAEAIGVSIDRQDLSVGSHHAAVIIGSNGGEATIAVETTVVASSSTALAGQIVDQFMGVGIGGLMVQFNGTSTTTDESGRFTIDGIPSSSLSALAISGPAVHTRTTFARSTDSRWLAIPSAFDMIAFNDLAREYEPRTIRWLNNPRIYVDSVPEGFAPGPELDQWIDEVRRAAAGFVSSWTGSAVTAASVTVTSAPPADGTAGTIVIHFSEDPARYSGPSTVGLARTWWGSRREIVASAIWLRYSLVSSSAAAREAVLGHELGHGIGMGHMEGTTSSIMTPRISIPTLSSFDTQAGSIVYSRSPGNEDPDSDSLSFFVGGLVPSTLAVGENTWVCGAPAR